MATGSVAEVAFELDGREVVRLFERPYRQPLDFGAEYAPHELIARAYDAKGVEMPAAAPRGETHTRTRLYATSVKKRAWEQPPPPHLTGASRLGPRPSKVSLTLDGAELALDP